MAVARALPNIGNMVCDGGRTTRFNMGESMAEAPGWVKSAERDGGLGLTAGGVWTSDAAAGRERGGGLPRAAELLGRA